MTTYPENSLLALQAAAELGYLNIELDIQLSTDLEPIVIHDENLKRTTGIDKNVRDLSANEISSIPLYSPSEFKNKNNLLHVPTLKQAVRLLNDYSKLNLFVEIKRQSIEQFGLKEVVDRTLAAQKHAKFNIIIISFVDKVIKYIKQNQLYATGYALKKYNEKYYSKAKELQPDYLFCNVKKINKPRNLWQGSWKWVLYDIVNPVFAYELLMQGVSLIETGDIIKLSNAEEFK